MALIKIRSVLSFIFQIVGLVSFIGLVHAAEINDSTTEDDVFQEFIETKTGLVGWRYQGGCYGEYDKGGYKIVFYSPPKRKDVGGYGVLETSHNGIENIYFGYEFYPIAGGNNCDFIKSYRNGELLVLDTENWASSKRYFISIDVSSSDVSAYSYSLKNTEIYKNKINDDTYLIAGFGLCQANSNSDWVSDIFCDDVEADHFRKAGAYLNGSIGLELYPEIVGIGKGVFKYYVITSGNNKYDQKKVEKLVINYLSDVARKVKTLKENGTKQQFYNGLLAIDSAKREIIDVEYELRNMGFSKQEISLMEKEFPKYWETIF